MTKYFEKQDMDLWQIKFKVDMFTSLNKTTAEVLKENQ